MNDIGRAIQTLRKRKNLTQSDLAGELNVSGQAVSKWENNLSQPDL
ncbi:MAG: helix-turn-helix domain-containing protein, partial [Candidatus Scatosoma sp.]